MIDLIMGLGLFALIIGVAYTISAILNKIGNTLDMSVLGHYIKLFIKIGLIFGLIVFIDNAIIKNSPSEETLYCNKETDTCIYGTNTYKDKEFKKANTFSISSIKSVKTRTFQTKSSGRRGRKIYTTHYVIDLYIDTDETFQYPITSNDDIDLLDRYRRFTSFLEDNNKIKYKDYKSNNIGDLSLYLLIAGVTLVLFIIYNDLDEWKAIKNEKLNQQRINKILDEKFTPQENEVIKNIIEEYKQKKNSPLSKEEIEIIEASVKYWRQHNGHSIMIVNSVKQLFDTGKGDFNIILDSIIWKYWKILYPEDSIKSQNDIPKLK